mmetsp:Transcript_11541/g.41565  ORF Transcript_11541/g.41565 Transcript_11541/m.41565 type:complete len:227 (+) Transcript_11541:203-883(+)
MLSSFRTLRCDAAFSTRPPSSRSDVPILPLASASRRASYAAASCRAATAVSLEATTSKMTPCALATTAHAGKKFPHRIRPCAVSSGAPGTPNTTCDQISRAKSSVTSPPMSPHPRTSAAHPSRSISGWTSSRSCVANMANAARNGASSRISDGTLTGTGRMGTSSGSRSAASSAVVGTPPVFAATALAIVALAATSPPAAASATASSAVISSDPFFGVSGAHLTTR